MKSFLIIDDDKSILKLHKILITNNYTDACVDFAENGEEALKKVGALDYTVILSDIDMPVMNGIDFYMNLKDGYPHLTNRVAFISGNLPNIRKSLLMEEGCPCLAKPFVQKDFYNIVDSILESQVENFISTHGRACNRQHTRYRVNEECILEPVLSGNALPTQINAELMDYSEGGLCLEYEGGLFQKETKMFVTIENLGIFQQMASVAWSSNHDKYAKAGMRWSPDN